jgi:hypothetical protein
VADQAITLERLGRYRSHLLDIAAFGNEVLIPVQNGELSPVDFYRKAVKTAGIPLVPAMPMKKAATAFAEVINFVQEVQPRRIHLLGMGYERSRARLLVRALQTVCPDLKITMDSNRIRAVTGKDRKMTRLEAKLRCDEPTSVFGEVGAEAFELSGCRLDYTDSISTPSAWLSTDKIESIADRSCMTSKERNAFVNSPDEFLQQPINGNEDLSYIELPHVAHALDIAWQSHVNAELERAVRTAAIRKLFSGARIALAS